MAGIYIHIPFCNSKCAYCGFYSLPSLKLKEQFWEALKAEIVAREDYLKQRSHCGLDPQSPSLKDNPLIHTIYFGGGTPSLLSVDEIGDILHLIKDTYAVASNAEITLEANPDTLSLEYLEGLRKTGINRLSIGIQSFFDNDLQYLGRRHNAHHARQCLDWAKQADFNNISLDLIYGLPGQTMEDWKKDVELALSLGIKHLSAYALSYEEGTRLDAMLRQGLVKEADEELSLQMYQHLMSATEEAGYLHYEISNFALPGYHSRHNSSYWQGTPYLGLGAGAHSYDGLRSRRANLPDVKAYIAATGDVPHETETLSDEELYNEFVMTRLRTSNGIPLDGLSPKDRSYCLSQAAPHLRNTLLIIRNNHLCLSKEGIFTSNDIISDLLK